MIHRFPDGLRIIGHGIETIDSVGPWIVREAISRVVKWCREKLCVGQPLTGPRMGYKVPRRIVGGQGTRPLKIR
jgi:hypothetical protein